MGRPDLAWQGPKVTQEPGTSQETICKGDGKEIQTEGGRVGWGDLAGLGPKVRGGAKPQRRSQSTQPTTSLVLLQNLTNLPNGGNKLYLTIDIGTLPIFVIQGL